MNELLFLGHIVLLYLIGVCFFQRKREWMILWLCTMPFLANLTIAKQITLWGFEVTSADVYSVAYFVGMNHYHETYGKKDAYKLVRLSLLFIFVMPLLLYIHTFYVPSSHDAYHEVFEKIFSVVPWVSCVSIISFALSQYLERFLFTCMQSFKAHYQTRSFLTTSISQLFDTAFFTYFAIGYLVHQPWHVFMMSYALKQLIICSWFGLSVMQKQGEKLYVRD